MEKKKIITIVSVSLIIIIVAIATIIMISKSREATKNVVAESSMEDKQADESIELIEEQPTEEPEETESPTSTATPNTQTYKYYIKVNNQMNTVTIYTKDSNGEYTVPVKAMVCSTGYASPKNSKYKTLGKWNWGEMIGGVYTQYETHITGNILFHSVPYLKRYDHSSLEYWAYDQLGTTCSAGCVRLTVADAKWIYDNCPVGTTVEFYSSSDPGPLGKPTAMKISSYTEYRGWDPTDPDSNNPWKNADLSTASPESTVTPTVEPTSNVQGTPVIASEEPTSTPTITPSVSPTPKVTTTPTVTPTVTATPKTTASSKPSTTATVVVPTITPT